MDFKFRKLSFKFHILKTRSTNISLTDSISCEIHYGSRLLFDKKFRIYLTCLNSTAIGIPRIPTRPSVMKQLSVQPAPMVSAL